MCLLCLHCQWTVTLSVEGLEQVQVPGPRSCVCLALGVTEADKPFISLSSGLMTRTINVGPCEKPCLQSSQK